MTQTAMIAAEGQSKEITGKAAQSAWISIANAGYGGPLTRSALADPSNSPTGIQAAVQAEINKQIADSQFSATLKNLTQQIQPLHIATISSLTLQTVQQRLKLISTQQDNHHI